jgi:ElaB/YqjD/DUF883 family membrane-anchored ribosome-binding protein
MATATQSESLSELERQAESTRAELAQTVDALHNRVSPAALKADMRDYVRDRSQHMMGRIDSFVRENPLQAAALAAGVAYPFWQMARRMPAPLLLIGAGLALSRRNTGYGGSSYMQDPAYGDAGYDMSSSGPSVTEKMSGMASDMADTVKDAGHRMTDTVKDTGQRVTDTVKDAGQRVSDTVSDTVSSAREAASDTAARVTDRVSTAYRSGVESAQHTAEQARTMMNQAVNTASDTMDRQPMLIGAVALALGGLLAAALPVTRQENRLMGSAADELKRRGTEMGTDALNRAKHVSDDLYRTTRDEIREQGFTPNAARNAVRAAADRIGGEADNLMSGESTGQTASNPANMENGNG